VSFATNGILESGFSEDDSATLTMLANLEYTGGYTNHQDAINFCNNQFPNDENSKNIIVLVTDGVPTRPGEGQEPSIFGLEAAEDAKNDGALILPVFVTTSYTGDQYDNSILLIKAEIIRTSPAVFGLIYVLPNEYLS